MRPRAFDEREVLEAAMRVFWEKGYEAASLHDLTVRMNIRKPSLYAAFGDKRELFGKVLDLYMRKHIAYVDEVLGRESAAAVAFGGLLRDLATAGSGGDPTLGCLAILTIDELARREPEWTAKTQAHQLRLAERFRQRIEQGISSGELAPDQDAAALAHALLAAVIGLTVMVKTRPDAAFVDSTIAGTLTLFKEAQS
ncbi:TetR/AcrR family transcriptional regulator [Saccharibacillus qingshengii]|uniref:TetR/AcrR family transcriptional regulator n=1 Tax=Saccharibacillus qingshengii TaxID=1763540 RepID=UPI001555F86E|nr:TetR/AcrR family transcriptional regulator [Saccharibacillus qingshengii]